MEFQRLGRRLKIRKYEVGLFAGWIELLDTGLAESIMVSPRDQDALRDWLNKEDEDA